MVGQIFFHFLFEGPGVDAKGIKFYRGPLQLIGQEIMLLGCQGFIATGKIYFKIQVPGRVIQIILIHVLQEHDGLAKFQHHPVQCFFFKFNLYVPDLEFRIQI